MNIHHFGQTNSPITLNMQNAFLSDRGSDAKAGFDISCTKQVVAPVVFTPRCGLLNEVVPEM